MSLLLLQVYKLSRENTQPENMYDIVFEKTKGRGGTVNRTSVYAKAAVRRGSLKKVLRLSSQCSQENICAGISFLIKLNSVDLQLH